MPKQICLNKDIAIPLSPKFTTMDYQKITIKITPFQEWIRDILNAEMATIGYNSFIEKENGVDAFIPADSYSKKALDEIFANCPNDFLFEVKKEFIKDQNWNEEWEKNYFQPLVIGNECVVRAPFHNDYPALKYEIVINPNMAFGTGNHETTTLMLEFILKSDMKDKTILDMGCGSGILGILASLKGAKSVTAIDIDQWSYEGTKENTKLNSISNITAQKGDASLLGNKKYDIIFANIQRNVLLNDMPRYNNVLNNGGLLIMSGFYKKDMQAIKERAESLSLRDAGYSEMNSWVAYAFNKWN